MRRPSPLAPAQDYELLLVAGLAEPRERARAAFARWLPGRDYDALDVAALRLLPLVVAHLGELLPANEPMVARARRSVALLRLRAAVLESRVRPLLVALGERGIPVLLLKGAALLPLYDGDPASRPMADLDLLIPTERRDEAWGCIEAAGFRSHDGIGRHAGVLRQRSGWNFIDGGGGDVDLHWRALHGAPHPASDDELWRTARSALWSGLPVLVPAPEETLLQLVDHASRWEPSPRVRWVADALRLLAAEPRIDFERLAERAEALGLLAALGAAFDYLARTFATALPARVIAGRERLAAAPRWQRRELAGRGRFPPERSRAERRAIAFGELWRRERPPGEIAPWRARAAYHCGRRSGWALLPAICRPALRRLAARRPPAALELVEPAARRLDFGDVGNATPHLAEGWSWSETAGRWTAGSEAALWLCAPVARAVQELVFTWVPFLAPGTERRRVEVWIAGRRALRLDYRGCELHRHTAAVAWPGARIAAGRPVEIRLVIDPPAMPLAAGVNFDERWLGLFVERLDLA